MSVSGADRLVLMANQIATFFDSQHGAAKAAETADHIRAFWDPRMRKGMLEHLHATGGAGLNPLALEAVKLLELPPVVANIAMAQAGKPSAKRPGDDAG